MKKPVVAVVIPALNEEKSIDKVIKELPAEWIAEVVVCDNGSRDRTAEVAAAAGATVVFQPLPGYGNACLKGLAHLREKTERPDIVVFIDGDYSDYPAELPLLLKPIIENDADLVIGSRETGERQTGAMTPVQIFGNWLATTLIRWFYGYRFTDLGPFRAIKWNCLMALDMADKNYGWTVEMQIKAAKMKMKTAEVAVSYRPRIGVSKVSGTVKGSLMAGYKILWLIFRSLLG